MIAEILALNKEERKIIKHLKQIGCTDESIEALVAIFDPFHDKNYTCTGYPDQNAGRSIVFSFTREAVMSASSAESKILAHVTPVLLPQYVAYRDGDAGGVYNPSSSGKVFVNVGNTPEETFPYGGVVIGQAPAGTDFDFADWSGMAQDPTRYAILSPFTADTNPTTLMASVQAEIAKFPGQFRVIGVGLETRNTSAELYKSGTSTMYVQQVSPEHDTHTFLDVVNTEGAKTKLGATTVTKSINDVVNVQRHPATLAEIKNMPDSITQESKLGSYQVARLNRTDNIPMSELDGMLAIVDNQLINAPASDCSKCFTGIAIAETVLVESQPAQYSNIQGKSYVGNFKPFGVMHTGLAAQSSITVTCRWNIEYFPNPDDSTLIPLSKPSCPFNSEMINVISKANVQLPVGVSVWDNADGDWFANLMGAVDMGSKFLSVAPDPRLKALGMVGGLASGLYHATKSDKLAPSRVVVQDRADSSVQDPNESLVKAIAKRAGRRRGKKKS